MGIDPGSRVTGWGVIEQQGSRLTCVGYGAIQALSSGSSTPMPQRLLAVFRELAGLLQQHRPDVVAAESIFHAANARSALMLGHVRGVALLAAAEAGVEVSEFSPMEIKKAVAGYGRADKPQVQAMVRTLLALPELPQPHDAADALAVAICRALRGEPSRAAKRSWRAVDPRRLGRG